VLQIDTMPLLNKIIEKISDVFIITLLVIFGGLMNILGGGHQNIFDIREHISTESKFRRYLDFSDRVYIIGMVTFFLGIVIIAVWTIFV